METYASRQQRAADVRRASYLLDEWDDTQKPALDRIERAALTLLHALDMCRADRLLADDLKAIDGLACDAAGRTIDLLRDLRATQCRELDACDGDPEKMRLETSELEAAHALWSARWDARKPT